MKLAVDSNKIHNTLNDLKAVDSSTLVLNQICLVEENSYVYYTNSFEGVKPNDLADNEPGRWVIKIKLNSIITKVPDNYDFVTNNKTEVTNATLIDLFLGVSDVTPIPEIITVDSLYGHSGTAFASIPLQYLLSKLSDLGPNYSKVEIKYAFSYATEGVSTMDARLYNYTDSAGIVETEKNFPNGNWVYGSSDWYDLTAYEGKAIRIQTKRNGGTGSNNILIEGAKIYVKYS